MIILNKELKIIKEDNKCTFCKNRLLENNGKCLEYLKKQNGITKCPYGFTSISTDYHNFCGLVVMGYSDIKKVNGHIKNTSLDYNYSIFNENDILDYLFKIENELIGNAMNPEIELPFFESYRNTIHNIKNTIRTLCANTNAWTTDEEDDLEIKNHLRDFKDGIDLIRTFLDYHDGIMYGDRLADYKGYLRPHKMMKKLSKILGNEAKNKKIKFELIGDTQNDIYNYCKSVFIMFFTALENAIKYSSIESEIKIEFSDLSDKTTKVRIINDTEGFDGTNLSKIFEKGYRGENSKRIDGTGLGMSLLLSLAKNTGSQCMVFYENEQFILELILSSISD